LLFEVGHFSKGCDNPNLADDNDDSAAVMYPVADDKPVTESFAEPQVMGEWGAAELATTDPIGTWALNVVTVPGVGGGW
jgi:hypothetical protein